ncbi:MAG: sugar ABC transporter substrate-binding protein [Candidatus Acidiferrales bacterium]
MKRLRILISLTTHDNDYQVEQGAAAKETANRLGVDVTVIYAENDSINQSQQLLHAIHAALDARPDGIVLEPVGSTGFPQVARAAASAGIGWAVLNCDVSYVTELRSRAKAPIFAISSNHTEIGRIQGRQMAALLPKGGTVLYIQGPSEHSAAKERTAGMQRTKPASVQLAVLKAKWTEESATRAVDSWLRLSTSQKTLVDLVVAQDDSMAVGARRAFEKLSSDTERARWLGVPLTGCDGLLNTGQAWVRSGVLAATVVVPANTPLALEMLVDAIKRGTQPAERALTVPKSYPAIDQLAAIDTGSSVSRR